MFSSRQKLQPTPKNSAPSWSPWQSGTCPYSLLIWIFHKLGLMHWMAFGVLTSAQGVCKTQWHGVISLLLWVKKIPFWVWATCFYSLWWLISTWWVLGSPRECVCESVSRGFSEKTHPAVGCIILYSGVLDWIKRRKRAELSTSRHLCFLTADAVWPAALSSCNRDFPTTQGLYPSTVNQNKTASLSCSCEVFCHSIEKPI